MTIPVKMTFTRDGKEIERETAEVSPVVVLDMLSDVLEVMLNAS